MLVTETRGEYSVKVEVKTNTGTASVSFGEGEPEDNTLSRDLNDVYSISELLKKAYNAGRVGESYKFEIINLED